MHESVASVGIGAAEHPLDAQIVLAAVLGLGVSAALWWIYFGGADDELAAVAMTRAPRTRRPSLALSAYFYPHIPILLGVVGLAAGVKLTIGHAAQPHPAAQALAIGGGAALFLAGHAAFRRVLRLGPVWPRLVTALFALATAALGATVAIEAQLIVLLAGLAAMLAAERLGARPLSARRKRRPAAPTHRSDQSHRADPAGRHGRPPAESSPRARCARIEHVIERYTRPEMGQVWSEAHNTSCGARWRRWSWRRTPRPGRCRPSAVAPVRAAPPPTPEAVAEVEAVTEHDVIAFLTAWADNTTPARGRRLRALRDDLLRPAGHGAGAAAGRGHRPAGGGGHPAGRRAARARPGAPRHAAGGPDARHPRRAGRLGAPGRRLRVRHGPQPGPAGPGPGRGRGRQAVRPGRHLLQHRPGHRGHRHGRNWGCARPTWPPRWCSATASRSGSAPSR